MKKPLSVVLSFLAVVTLVGAAAAQGTLQEVKKKGVLVAGVFNSVPPFGFVDKTGEIVGFDVDYAKAFADKLGVKLKLVPVTSGDRIPELLEGDIDIIAAMMVKNPDREKLLDFSDTYFLTGQKFLVKKGTVRTLKDLQNKTIGVRKGSVSEQTAKEALPHSKIVPFDNYILGLRALRNGEVDAVTSDELILRSLLSRIPHGGYEIPAIRISERPHGFGIRKGDESFLDFVNKTILTMEESGETAKIYSKWFAPRATVAHPAYGTIMRETDTRARFLVMALKGVFWKNAEVSVFDPAGDFICKGTVKDIFEDEIYVDVDKAKAGTVTAGFVIAMNASNEGTRAFISTNQKLLQAVKRHVRKDEKKMEQDIKLQAREDRKKREEEQFQVYMKEMDNENGWWRYNYPW
ncbi:MAG: transporter substrate-binding domain-containing protein [Desulfobacteria bacterium]